MTATQTTKGKKKMGHLVGKTVIINAYERRVNYIVEITSVDNNGIKGTYRCIHDIQEITGLIDNGGWGWDSINSITILN